MWGRQVASERILFTLGKGRMMAPSLSLGTKSKTYQYMQVGYYQYSFSLKLIYSYNISDKNSEFILLLFHLTHESVTYCYNFLRPMSLTDAWKLTWMVWSIYPFFTLVELINQSIPLKKTRTKTKTNKKKMCFINTCDIITKLDALVQLEKKNPEVPCNINY